MEAAVIISSKKDNFVAGADIEMLAAAKVSPLYPSIGYIAIILTPFIDTNFPPLLPLSHSVGV